jgi:hypothetical protein
MESTESFSFGSVEEKGIQSFSDLLRKRKLGVDYWHSRQPREPIPLPTDEVLDTLRLFLEPDSLAGIETLLDEDTTELPRDVAAAKRRLADQVLGFIAGLLCTSCIASQQLGAVDNLRVADPEGRLQALAKLLATHNHLGSVAALILAGDSFAAGDEEVSDTQAKRIALRLYEMAVDAAPRPGIHAELAAVLLHHADLDLEAHNMGAGLSVVLMSGELELLQPSPSTVEGYGFDPSLFEEQLLSGPLLPTERGKLLHLALECLGRAYGYYAMQARNGFPIRIGHNLGISPFESVCSVLDGIRVISTELGDNALLFDTYWAYYVWAAVTHTDEPILTEYYARRFAYGLGLSLGREQRSEQRSATEEAQRVVGVFADQTNAVNAEVATEARIAPEVMMAESEKRVSLRVGAVWADLPLSVKEILMQAEYLELVHSDEPLFEWSSAAGQYSRAVERLLRDVFDLGDNQRERRELTIGDFANRLPKFASTGRRAGLARKLAGKLQWYNQKYRNPVEHWGQPIHYGTIRQMQKVLFDPDQTGLSVIGMIIRLSGYHP